MTMYEDREEEVLIEQIKTSVQEYKGSIRYISVMVTIALLIQVIDLLKGQL